MKNEWGERETERKIEKRGEREGRSRPRKIMREKEGKKRER